MAEPNLGDDVYARLSERILKWEYPPGHRLTEEELCAEFGVSRSPVREALGALAERGLVEKRPRQGYTVRRLDLEATKELYDLRIILEVGVVEILCRDGLDSAIVEGLESRWKELRDGLPGLAEGAVEADEEFHRSLAKGCRNSALLRVLAEIDEGIHFVRMADITDSERLAKTCDDHLEVLGAIKRRDAKSAGEAMRRNIEWGKANVEAAIREALVHAHLSV